MDDVDLPMTSNYAWDNITNILLILRMYVTYKYYKHIFCVINWFSTNSPLTCFGSKHISTS